MPVNAGVEVVGLKEFRRDLNKVDKELTKELRRDLLEIGRDVAADAAAMVPVRSGRARDSIKAGVSGNNAYVQGGKKTVPYFGWLDFGGVLKPTGGRRNTITRERKKSGRFIYPAIKSRHDDIKRRAVAAFEKAKHAAFKSPLP